MIRAAFVKLLGEKKKNMETITVGELAEYFTPDHEMPDADERDPDEGPDEMFPFIKVTQP